MVPFYRAASCLINIYYLTEAAINFLAGREMEKVANQGKGRERHIFYSDINYHEDLRLVWKRLTRSKMGN